MIKALARLIRFPNLVIVALTQFLLYYVIFNRHFAEQGIPSRMDLHHFSQLVLVTLMLTAGGYIINDVMDLEADKINKPDKLIISRYISRRTALWIYFCLQAVGFFLAIHLSFYVKNLRLLSLYPTAAIGLYAYSAYLKRKPLVGHLLIAAYCAGVALVVWLSEYPAYLRLSEQDPILANYLKKITIAYASFAFLATLLRELIKVLQDEKGDRKAGYRTTVIAWGPSRLKKFCVFLCFLLLVMLGVTAMYFQAQFELIPMLLVLGTLALPVFLVIIDLTRRKTRSNFKRLSKLTKILMLLGVLALLAFI